jgi:hypothetical protein
MRYGAIAILLLLASCAEVVLGLRFDDDKIAPIEVRNPGIVSYDVWLVVRDQQLDLQSEYLILTGLNNRADALTFVQHIGWDSERVVVSVALNDRISDQQAVMTDGTKITIAIVP